MRILIAAAAFTAGAVWGVCKSSTFHKRAQLISELKRLTTEFSIAIRCTAPTLDELARDCSGIFGELLRSEMQKCPDIRCAWQNAVQRLSVCGFCGKEETAVLSELGRELGTCSAEGQLAMLELHRCRLDKLSAEADECAKSKGKLFRSVGALLGAGAAVLII